jgi:choline dehydrogenase-like flavoprotein
VGEHQTILIGAGVAAATIAKTLLEGDPKHHLLVLEAGPPLLLKDRRAWWDYVITGRAAYAHCHDLPLPPPGSNEAAARLGETENASLGKDTWIFQESRVMGLGGTTTHWGGWALRFKPEDFKLRTNTKRGADWPIEYEDFEPYYGSAERLLSAAGDDRDKWTPRSENYPLPPFTFTAADGPMIDAFQKLGIRYGTMPVARYRKCMTTGTCKYCPLGSRFAAAYLLEELLDCGRYPNLKFRTRCPVTSLLHDRKNRIAGVRYLDGQTGQARTARGERYVLCSGAIESPKLLLRSRSGFWPDGIGNDHNLVGRNLISHTLIYALGTSKANPERHQQELDFPVLMSRHYDTPDYQHDGKLFLFRDRTLPGIPLAQRMIEGKTRDEIDKEVTGPATWSLQGFMEEFANPDNRVELGDGLNRLGLPQTRVFFSRADGFAQASQVRLGLMEKVIRTMGLDKIKTEVTTVRGDHAASTCRMAKTPNEGVVDENLAVFGIDNLFIGSNAVFPSGAAVNPTLTLTALSIRLGEHLLGRAPRPRTLRPVAAATTGGQS